jgi:hypothetical protein
MTAWFVAAIPLLIMFFALGMERVEARLRQVAVAEKDVEEFLEQARPDEVRALFRQGIGRALEQFRLRRRTRRPSHRSVGVAPFTVHDPDPLAATVPLPKVRVPPRRRAS